MAVRRTREMKPLSSEHHQALLVAFQLKKGLAGHAESAGAPKDLAGLLTLARRFQDSTLATHTRAEEDLLSSHLAARDAKRLRDEHRQLDAFLETARKAHAQEVRQALTAFADLLERHVRWEERELFPACEAVLDGDALASIGHELERRLVLSRNDARPPRRP